MDPASLAFSSHQHKTGPKSKKRGRGRPPLGPFQIPSATATPAQAVPLSAAETDQVVGNPENTEEDPNKSVPMETTDEPNEEQQHQKEGENPEDNDNEEEDDNINNQETNMKLSSATTPNEINSAEQTTPVSEVVSPPPSHPAVIPNIHPLAGVWKGNFSITTLKGLIAVFHFLCFSHFRFYLFFQEKNGLMKLFSSTVCSEVIRYHSLKICHQNHSFLILY
jgi:hypothetical protein